MKKVVQPRGGFPWNRPGYRFSVGWPQGYEFESKEVAAAAEAAASGPSTKELLAAAGERGGSSIARSQVTDKMRAGGLEALPTGRGSLGVLSPRSNADVAKSDKLRRGGI